jgi:hypothetical protein
LTLDSKPLYKNSFLTPIEGELVYKYVYRDYIWPSSFDEELGYGHIDIVSDTYVGYLSKLIDMATVFDELWCDNLYRNMTHESIKNFDWTYTREYNEGDELEYVHGGEKIQKALRIFAREFDEQKKYIDNIKNTGKLSYDERGNIPDYFLADLCEDDGWDVKSVIPYDLSGITDYSDTALLGTVYYLFVYDYPNYKKILGNKKLFMRIYNELFTKVSVYINCINEWLNLYSSLRDITSVLALPPCMREKDVLSCLKKLRKYGILDDSYQVTARARKGSFRQLIGQHLYIKGCKWHILEEHFNESNLRVHSDLDRFKNRMSKNEAQDWEVEIYKLIEECFV